MSGLDAFLAVLERLPRGYSEGHYDGRRYGVTHLHEAGGQRVKLFAEELGGNDVVSFNLYRLADGSPRLKPCEMSAEKVVDFVLGYRTEA